MNTRKEYAAIDYFRLAAAFMIVAIHTGPLEDISKTADFLVTYCLGRIGVPFFLMVTGYFMLAGFCRQPSEGLRNRLFKYLLRFFLMYVGVTLLYLPFTIYAGNLPHGIGGWLQWFLMDGSFYHLWYLPAALVGCLITAALLRFCPLPVSGAVVALLYAVGLLGDSYYGLVSQVEPLKRIYEVFFNISTYTRNGIFYAPVFLWIGAVLGRNRRKDAVLPPKSRSQKAVLWTIFGVCLALMLGEGFFTWTLGLQKHNSMYVLLLPVSIFLFMGLLQTGGKVPAVLRPVSMWIYLLHPLCIIGVRGVAKVVKLQAVLVDNSLIFYIVVCISSFTAAMAIEWLRGIWHSKKNGLKRHRALKKTAVLADDKAVMGTAVPEDLEGVVENVSQGKSMDRIEGREPEGECGGIPENNRP